MKGFTNIAKDIATEALKKSDYKIGHKKWYENVPGYDPGFTYNQLEIDQAVKYHRYRTDIPDKDRFDFKTITLDSVKNEFNPNDVNFAIAHKIIVLELNPNDPSVTQYDPERAAYAEIVSTLNNERPELSFTAKVHASSERYSRVAGDARALDAINKGQYNPNTGQWRDNPDSPVDYKGIKWGIRPDEEYNNKLWNAVIENAARIDPISGFNMSPYAYDLLGMENADGRLHANGFDGISGSDIHGGYGAVDHSGDDNDSLSHIGGWGTFGEEDDNIDAELDKKIRIQSPPPATPKNITNPNATGSGGISSSSNNRSGNSAPSTASDRQGLPTGISMENQAAALAAVQITVVEILPRLVPKIDEAVLPGISMAAGAHLLAPDLSVAEEMYPQAGPAGVQVRQTGRVFLAGMALHPEVHLPAPVVAVPAANRWLSIWMATA